MYGLCAADQGQHPQTQQAQDGQGEWTLSGHTCQ